MSKKNVEEFKEVVDTLIGITVSHVLENAIGTFIEMKKTEAQEKIAKDFIAKVFLRSTKQAEEYFNNLKK